MCENPNLMKKKRMQKKQMKKKNRSTNEREKKHKIDDVQDQHNSGAMANFSHFDQDKL